MSNLSNEYVMNYIAIDIGSGLVKFSNKDGRHFFPTEVGKSDSKDDFNYGFQPYEIIEHNNITWFTGHAAASHIKKTERTVSTKASWSETQGHLILLYSAIAKLHPKGFKGSMNIVTGLPIKTFREKVNSYKAKLVGKHAFRSNDCDYEVEIIEDKTIVLPQVIGLHFSNMLENRKSKVNWQAVKVGYIDPGTETIGFAVMEDGRYQDILSGGENTGLVKLARVLMKALKEGEHGWCPKDESDMLKALYKGYVEIFDDGTPKTIDLIEFSRQYTPNVYASALESIKSKWSSGKDMRIILGSGGGIYLDNFVKKTYPHAELLNKRVKKNETTNEKDIFDVVEGYATYAENVWSA